jgi:hypothetical protein
MTELIDHDAVPEGQLFRPAQQRRVEALKIARQILEVKPGVFSGSKVEANRQVYDLTYLADWIIAGPDETELTDDAPELMPSPSPDPWEPIDHDAEATAELRAARSDFEDGN